MATEAGTKLNATMIEIDALTAANMDNNSLDKLIHLQITDDEWLCKVPAV
jgi:hypothetical protein